VKGFTDLVAKVLELPSPVRRPELQRLLSLLLGLLLLELRLRLLLLSRVSNKLVWIPPGNYISIVLTCSRYCSGPDAYARPAGADSYAGTGRCTGPGSGANSLPARHYA
jgi:hypothetical protein